MDGISMRESLLSSRFPTPALSGSSHGAFLSLPRPRWGKAHPTEYFLSISIYANRIGKGKGKLTIQNEIYSVDLQLEKQFGF